MLKQIEYDNLERFLFLSPTMLEFEAFENEYREIQD